MQKGIVLFFLFTTILLADSQVIAAATSNTTVAKTQQQIEEDKQIQDSIKVTRYLAELQGVMKDIGEEKVWTKSYASYLTSLDVKEKLKKIQSRIKYLKKHAKNLDDKEELNSLISKEKIFTAQMEHVKDTDTALFANLITPPEIAEIPKISNPFDIFTGMSYIKKINADLEGYNQKKDDLSDLIALVEKAVDIDKKILAIKQESEYVRQMQDLQKELDRFQTALDTINVASEVHQKRVEIAKASADKAIQDQIFKLINLGIIVLVVFLIFFLLKLIVKKYITDNERFYMANKIITFTNFILIILIVFFNYIENASYIVTILGFASAGIAIAMKDWFMSLLGWLVIVFGGSIHVGDRIRVDMDGMKYIGDVMDISLLRITILEDITLTAITHNRRAGRIIFIPNNYIFTNMIANYTHSSLKTVWDGVNITITFDSNHKKAMHLVKEITKKFSKGYTDITRKQLNKLRHNYNLKNTNVEPRIFSFIEPNGISIDAWYLTNAYATLTLRSVISTEIVDAFNKESDITIAYPTQNIHLEKGHKETEVSSGELV